MSKWTTYQLLIIISLLLLIVFIHTFSSEVAIVFSWIDSFISPEIIVTFLSVILIVWGFSFILLLQEKKGELLFTHKLWRIMPAIMGALLLVSFVIFIALGMTVLADLDRNMKWILDVFIIYFLIIFYLLVLSIVIRYTKADTVKGRIITSANAAVLILIVILFFIPSMI